MTAKCFADTNIVLYTIGQDTRKAGIARGIVAVRPLVSAQVINEAINVCLRKLGFDRAKAYSFADSVMLRTDVLPIDETTIRKSAELAIRYQLSNWDALIAAAALLSGCDILYSEDMQNGQVFEGKLTVANPFL
ncbi:MAG: PIN domain-containing protein [Sulfurimicrobium sp.]|nr:PIN domain-containing protein [Sulfurimicrobium sp.]